jgi:hypothetical protein
MNALTEHDSTVQPYNHLPRRSLVVSLVGMNFFSERPFKRLSALSALWVSLMGSVSLLFDRQCDGQGILYNSTHSVTRRCHRQISLRDGQSWIYCSPCICGCLIDIVVDLPIISFTGRLER